MPSVDVFDFSYPVEVCPHLLMLLQEWKMEFFYNTFVDEMITVPVLKIIQQHHINELMSKFPNIPMGIKVLFMYKLQQWQNNNPVNRAET